MGFGLIAAGFAFNMFSTVLGMGAKGMNATERRNQLREQKKKLEADKKRLTQSYEDNKKSLADDYNISKGNLNYNIGYTQMVREQNAVLSANSNVASSKNAYEEISDMVMQYSTQEGSAIQRSANTGLRNTGSNMNIVNSVQQSYKRAITSSMERASLNSYQLALQASNSYLDATSQADRYKQNVFDLTTQYNNSLTSLKNQYDQRMADYDYDIEQIQTAFDNAKYSAGEAVVDFFGGLIGASINTANQAVDLKTNEDTKNLMREQIAMYEKIAR